MTVFFRKSFSLTIIVFFLFCLNGITFAAPVLLVTDDGSKYYDSSPVPGQTAKWSGDRIQGLADGPGILQYYQNGVLIATYRGSLVKGMLQGMGSISWFNGFTYEGMFLNSDFNGRGLTKFPNGNSYDGDYVNGKRTGTGIYKWQNGDSYQGDFVDGVMSGSGIYRWADSSYYEGDFANNEFQGAGIRYNIDGSILQQGKWEHGHLVE
jgi:hypothetical protein